MVKLTTRVAGLSHGKTYGNNPSIRDLKSLAQSLGLHLRVKNDSGSIRIQFKLPSQAWDDCQDLPSTARNEIETGLVQLGTSKTKATKVRKPGRKERHKSRHNPKQAEQTAGMKGKIKSAQDSETLSGIGRLLGKTPRPYHGRKAWGERSPIRGGGQGGTIQTKRTKDD